jgi:hypothetical protein
MVQEESTPVLNSIGVVMLISFFFRLKILYLSKI